MLLEKVPLAATDLRYLSALAMTLVSSIKKRRSTAANTAVAIAILWMAYGLRNTLFVLASVLGNILALWLWQPSPHSLTAINLVNLYLYKIFGRLFEPRIGGTFDISGFLMILTVKAGY